MTSKNKRKLRKDGYYIVDDRPLEYTTGEKIYKVIIDIVVLLMLYGLVCLY